MNSLLSFLRSPRLAILLIAVMATLAALATFVPQGRDPAFYRERFGSGAAWTIGALGLDRFFASPIFLAPAGLFTINLTVCSVDRWTARRRSGARPRYGPDLVHLGLLVLIAGGILSATLRREELFYLGEGDVAELPGGSRLRLESFRSLTYESGAPKDWISSVRVEQSGREARLVDVEVNHPLRLGGIRIFQASLAVEGTVRLRDAVGAEYTLAAGESLDDSGTQWRFVDISNRSERVPRAVLQRLRANEVVATVEVGTGESAGRLTVAAISTRELSGLKAVRDPGFLPALSGLALVGAGLALTFVQKAAERRP
jgi:cytochrome c biogenesis protein